MIIQVVALPILSTRLPNNGVNTTVKKGIIDTIIEAVCSKFAASAPNLGIRIAVANFLNEMIQQ